MKNSGLLVGCGIATLAVLLLCGGMGIVGWYGARWTGDLVSSAIESESHRRRLATQWQRPPRDASSEAIFPQQVGPYQLVSIEPPAAVAELGIDNAGHHAIYQGGSERIEVYLYPMTAEQADAVFAGVAGIAEKEVDGLKLTSGFSSTVNNFTFNHYYLYTDQLGTNYLWFVQDWLMVVRTEDRTNTGEDFIHTYMQPAPAAAVPAAPADANPVAPTEESPIEQVESDAA